MTTNDETFESLATKLNGLDLTDAERDVFGMLIGAEAAEVEGHSAKVFVGNLSVIQGFDLGKKGFDIGMPPTVKEDVLEFGEKKR